MMRAGYEEAWSTFRYCAGFARVHPICVPGNDAIDKISRVPTHARAQGALIFTLFLHLSPQRIKNSYVEGSPAIRGVGRASLPSSFTLADIRGGSLNRPGNTMVVGVHIGAAPLLALPSVALPIRWSYVQLLGTTRTRWSKFHPRALYRAIIFDAGDKSAAPPCVNMRWLSREKGKGERRFVWKQHVAF